MSEQTNIVLDELKKEGLDLAEEAVAGVVKALFRAIPKLVGTSLSIILIPILAAIEPIVLGLVDKIDGEDDADR